MPKDYSQLTLYDTDVISLLTGWPTPDLLLPHEHYNTMGEFEHLREPELIYAIYHRNYTKACRLLNHLKHPLPPQDAMAACLCALRVSHRLLNKVLDHCPPIPDFQFQGVGKVSSLMNVALGYSTRDDLDLLLRRGASINGGPTPDTAEPPLSVAFCNRAYGKLRYLLEIPGVDLSLTEDMLLTLGMQQADRSSYNPIDKWYAPCCRLLMETLTGKPVAPAKPLPLPPQLRLGHALHNGNIELALRICRERPLTEQDKADAGEYFWRNDFPELLKEDSDPGFFPREQKHLEFLLCLLEGYPDLLEDPYIRSGVVYSALIFPRMDVRLQPWIKRMADGPVEIGLPIFNPRDGRPFFHYYSAHAKKLSLDSAFFPRWDERLGSRIIPAVDPDYTPDIRKLSQQELTQLLPRVHLLGEAAPGKLRHMALLALQCAPENLLPTLLQPDKLLGREDPAALLDACQTLPLARRNLVIPHILPHIHKTVDLSL